MNKFSFMIALFSTIPHIAQGEGTIIGNVKWNSSGKALTDREFGEKYKLGSEKDTGGAFSTFRDGTVKSSGEEVVMKLEDPNNQHKVCFLPQEVQVYEDLQKRASNLLEKGFANLYDYGIYKGKRALVISKLGKDIVYDVNSKGIFYSWDELLPLAKNTIESIQFLHDTGYIHQDVKPENFMYGKVNPKKLNQTENVRVSLTNRVYMIDFGAASKYRDANGTCYNQTASGKFAVMTEPYRSRTSRYRMSKSRRDDMETLGYSLLSMVGVDLPWDQHEDEPIKTADEKLEEQNRLCDALEVVRICRLSDITDERIHVGFLTYFTLLKKLFTVKDGFFKEPDYDAFKKCFDKNPKDHYRKVTAKENTVTKAGKNLKGAK